MENKYYIPELREIYVGAEYYENQQQGLAGPITVRNREDVYSTLEDLEQGLVKIKNLDADDFFSLGFFERQQYPGVYCIGDDYSFYFHVGKWFAKKQEHVIFWGNIKNKSELKKLLIQLGIL